MTLTREQKQAVTRLGQDVCLVAGPGSGKTRVLVERFRWLVDSQGVPPARILAITFTEKAAYEIRKRLVEESAADLARRSPLGRAPVLTIHAFCTRLLREHAIAAGIDPEFEILDERNAHLLLTESIHTVLNALLAADERRLLDLYEHWGAPDPVTALADAYEAVRQTGDDFPPPRAHQVASPEQTLRRALTIEPANTAPRREAALAVMNWLDESKETSPGEIVLPRGYRGGFREAIREAATGWATEKFHAQRETLDFLLREIHRIYGDTKRVRSVLDFDDLEAFSIRLLEGQPNLQNEVRQRFEYVLMDEVQDTNPLQWRLLKLIRREGRFFGVGDINQAIYGFRGARPDGFRELREDVKASGGVVDFLRENFRSREEILRAAEALLGRADGMEPPNLCASRVFAPDSSPAVERFVVPTAEEDPKEILLQREAREVCRRIQEMVSQYLVDTRAGNGRPARYSDIAVLFRTTLRFDEYGREFLRADIPCVMTGGRTLFERQEILDAVSWLRVLANPRDEVSLAAVMRSPFGGIGDEVLLSMRVPEVNLVHSARNSDNPGVRRLMKLLDGQRSVRDHSPPDLLLAQAFDSSGYEDVLDPAARANLRRLLEIVAERHTVAAEPIASLVSFLKEAAAEGEPAAGTSSTTDAVSIMTMHAAKGLEFPIVFLPSLDLAATADSTALVYSSADGLGATWRSGPGRTVRDLAAERFRETAAQHRREEANRLLYVAITRAEQRLIVSSVQDRGGWAPLIASMPVEPVTAPDPVQLGLFV